MSEKKIPLKEATEAQLRAFAESHLGMNFVYNMKRENMVAKIAEAWSKDEITVIEPDGTEALEGSAPRPVTAAQKAPVKGKIKLIISRTEEDGGDEPVPVGVNGKVMLIPRGEPVEIPEPYFRVLEDATKHIYEALPDGGLNPVPRKIQAYPFQRLA